MNTSRFALAFRAAFSLRCSGVSGCFCFGGPPFEDDDEDEGLVDDFRSIILEVPDVSPTDRDRFPLLRLPPPIFDGLRLPLAFFAMYSAKVRPFLSVGGGGKSAVGRGVLAVRLPPTSQLIHDRDEEDDAEEEAGAAGRPVGGIE